MCTAAKCTVPWTVVISIDLVVLFVCLFVNGSEYSTSHKVADISGNILHQNQPDLSRCLATTAPFIFRNLQHKNVQTNQPPRSRQITTPAPHALLGCLEAGCPSCHPTNSVKALKATVLVEYLETVKISRTVILTNKNKNVAGHLQSRFRYAPRLPLLL